ncbi:MAG TPA: hypothetical protein VF013_04905 [Candidatus Limnocylindria bacterium]
MFDPCIHGFIPDQCASCRTCPHGLSAARCGRCQAKPTTKVSERGSAASQEHLGWEIIYVPALSGWQVRQPDTTPSADSYRSVFLARKAIERLQAAPPAAPRSKRGR